MAEGNSVINLGDLSKTATVLIEKISEATGGIFRPYQIVRVAKAQAEADKINAAVKIEISDLEQRALRRFMHEEGKKQSNIESIANNSFTLLGSEAKPEKIEEDWITNFFDKCRIVSDKEMQDMWSRILAGEANTPGSFSKRTINFMASLDKNDASLFTKLCSFNWQFGELQPLIYDTKAEIYTQNDINFSTLNHLDAIGLLSFESLTGYIRKGFQQKGITLYDNTAFNIVFPKEKDNDLSVGHVLLTSIGRELAMICKPKKISGFDHYIIQKFKENGVELTPLTQPSI